jgi:type I restriction enzyme S subunit
MKNKKPKSQVPTPEQRAEDDDLARFCHAAALRVADQLEVRLAQARIHVDALMPSLLARAFAGQLVPQDPTDEPAEKFLQRIRNTQGKRA